MTTLNRRIRAHIEQRILSGDWPPGHRIPFEHELMAEFGCARMTVNKAIAALVDAGLIVRRRRGGSFVAEPRVHAPVLAVPDIRAEVETRSRRYSHKLLMRRRRTAVAGNAVERQLAGAADLLELECLHMADDRPFAFEERQISLAAAPSAEDVDFSVTPPGTWLLDAVPWTEAEHRIAAINADKRIADLLDIKPHTACLLVERRTWRGEVDVTHVRQIFPGSDYDLIARFTPKS
ncbi:transcriptional regulator, GntR family [Sphingomonas laterariae]|uniref:Histidine utilization repressor n=1 Tax=Edaphosphingomonas laterariae TaxID=861865 RepID=A0A239BJW5_9SPHN|nr:histidine utilization repressor [Sphingomonas laterariae]SNS07668.1 transcriptional regulator, GntR family [Sphingomonas laterariae]